MGGLKGEGDMLYFMAFLAGVAVGIIITKLRAGRSEHDTALAQIDAAYPYLGTYYRLRTRD